MADYPFIYFETDFVTIYRPSSESTVIVCDVVWTIAHWHLSEDARPHLCRFAAQWPRSVIQC